MCVSVPTCNTRSPKVSWCGIEVPNGFNQAPFKYGNGVGKIRGLAARCSVFISDLVSTSSFHPFLGLKKVIGLSIEHIIYEIIVKTQNM